MCETRRKIATSYRVKEPIQNFKFRVKIVQHRSPLAELLDENVEETRDTSFLEEEDRIFGWQQKLFSPFEIDLYSDERNCITDHQKSYHRQITDQSSKASHLYTYTEKDSYFHEDSILTKPYRSHLSIKNRSALPALQNLKPFSERYNKSVIEKATDGRIRKNHYLYSDKSVMYVLADLSRKDRSQIDKDSEVLLCTVTFDRARNLLVIDPDFSGDRCYTIVNNNGVKYDYWIEHVSEKPSQTEFQRQKEELKREIQQQIAYRQIEISHQGIQLTPPNVLRVFLTLTIVSAHEFKFDGLFVTYFVDLPQNWSTNQPEKLYGRTQRCKISQKSAFFGHVSEVSIDFRSNGLNSRIDAPIWPRILLSVASLDSWTRYRVEGYGALSVPLTAGSYNLTVPTWRATGTVIDSLRRIFTGGTHELEDITFCGVPMGHEGKTLDKMNLRVVPSGQVNVKLDIVHQSRTLAKGLNSQDEYLGIQSTDSLMNNVENVFEQFKAARERMIQIRNLKF